MGTLVSHPSAALVTWDQRRLGAMGRNPAMFLYCTIFQPAHEPLDGWDSGTQFKTFVKNNLHLVSVKPSAPSS